jgi:hypothetical protein
LMMLSARQIVIAVLAVALAAYAFDCSAMMTPQHAVECCRSMACSPQGHASEDCCKAMPAMHAPFVQPSSSSSVAPPAVQPAVLAVIPHVIRPDSSRVRISANEQAPPGNNASDLTPLRI